MQAIWDLEQGKYGFGMFAYSIFFPLSLSPSFFLLSHFSPGEVGVGDDLGIFSKNRIANVYAMPRVVV